MVFDQSPLEKQKQTQICEVITLQKLHDAIKFYFAANLKSLCDRLPACIENSNKHSDDVAFIFFCYLFVFCYLFLAFFFVQNQEFDGASYLNVSHFTASCS